MRVSIVTKYSWLNAHGTFFFALLFGKHNRTETKVLKQMLGSIHWKHFSLRKKSYDVFAVIVLYLDIGILYSTTLEALPLILSLGLTIFLSNCNAALLTGGMQNIQSTNECLTLTDHGKILK